MEKYNREQFIKNYSLTKDEYSILSEEERMEYANQLYGYKVSDLKNFGDTAIYASVIDPLFYEYFQKCGCQVTEDDLGAEVTEITKVDENTFTQSQEAEKKLKYHINLIAITKAEMFEERLRNFYKVKNKKKGQHFKETYDYVKNLYVISQGKVGNLPAYEQRWLIPVQLENLIKSLDRGNSEYFDLFVKQEYIDYLIYHDYKVKEESKRYLLHK